MATLFTKIIDGELPGRFVHRGERTVAFLTIAPVRPGHVLVVPRAEVDDWLDLRAEDRDDLFAVAHTVGAAVRQAFPCRRVALAALGLEVPHVHLHLIPIDSESDVDFSRADAGVDPSELDRVQERLLAALGTAGGR
jgi:diadenosine tetraphosphate (Ap4A) HIT family hydrolase